MKVTFNKLVVLLCFCFVSNCLFGQELTQDDLVKSPSELIDANLNGNGNEAYLSQIGNRNTVNVIQSKSSVNAENLVRVLQVGNRNVGQINQTEGILNQTVLIQNGNRNEYTLNLEGSENNFVIVQDGNRNTINQNLTNNQNTYIELVQVGNDNEITHTQDGLNNQQIIIRQEGNGLKMDISQSNN